MINIGLLCLSVLLLLNPLQTAIAMDFATIFRMPAFKIGMAGSAGTVEVSDSKSFSDVPFKSSSSLSPLVALIQPPVYFGEDTRWGYHTELNVKYFKLDYDNDDGRYQDGELKGYTVDVTPVFFYQWGYKNLCANCRSWRVEAGLGINYLNSDGELQQLGGKEIAFSSVGFGFNSHIGAVVNYRQWELGLRLVVPARINDDDDDADARHALSSVSLAYRF
ncbi:hypothetical protein [Photobacterium sp.]|uniref:hypothetical protein n=1 Tax=Photobacterium sp. TaxID=660 RepID=UPI00299F1BDC|nr:hypothetical protein [Photobacterium sp.]MDX1302107.1 hypothetical protein [Photobacterium sp.]